MEDSLLTLKNINAYYGSTQILYDVGFSIGRGRIVGLVGESGSGKSTVARVISGLLSPQSGELVFDGEALNYKRSRDERKRIQMVFQNPEGSLNPKYKTGKILKDAALFHGIASKENVENVCKEMISRLDLPADSLNRYPKSFSGGEKQRIALARALIVEPKLLIADEPTSSLDVSVQLRILDMIKKIREERNITILFISHDMGVIKYLCDDIVVMHEGKIIESESCKEFFISPRTEYGKELLDAVPSIPRG